MKSKLKIIIPIAISVVVIALAAVFISFKPQEITDVTALMDTARIALSDDKFEEAIAAFEKIINLDPNNADAYIGIAEVYEKMGDIDSAVYWLEKGQDRTGDGRISEYLARLKGESEELRVESEVVTTTTAETTTAPETTTSAEEEELFLMEQEEMVSFTVAKTISGQPQYVARELNTKYGTLELRFDNETFYINELHGQNSFISDNILSLSEKCSVSVQKLIPDYFNVYNLSGQAIAYCNNWCNSNGAIVKREYYNNDEIVHVLEYEYDEEGRISSVSLDGKKIEYIYDHSGNIIEESSGIVYKYDSDFNLIKEGSWQEYDYDLNGNCILNRLYIDGEIAMEIIYEYHPNNVMSKQIYNGFGSCFEKKYNSAGKITWYKTKMLNGINDNRDYISEYNEYGDRISYSIVNTEGLVEMMIKYTYKYDDYGRLKEISSLEDNGNASLITYEYNSLGEIECITTVNDVNEEQTKFEYDSNGNKVRVEYYENNVLKGSAEVTEFIRVDIPKSVLEEAKKASHLYP